MKSNKIRGIIGASTPLLMGASTPILANVDTIGGPLPMGNPRGNVKRDGIGGSGLSLIGALDQILSGDKAPEYARMIADKLKEHGMGGCASAMASSGAPAGCYTDECGRTFVRAGSRAIQVRAPETVREKYLSFSGTYTSLAGGNNLSFDINPQVPFFVARRLVATLTSDAGLTLSDLFLTSFKVGTNDQQSANIQNASGFNSNSNAMSLAVLANNSVGIGVDLDVATPNNTLKIQLAQRAVAAPPATPVTVSFVIFGIAFEALSECLTIRHGTFPRERLVNILFKLHGWSDNPVENCDLIRSLVVGLAKVNYAILSRGGFPFLYDSGVSYQAEDPGKETWLDVVGCLAAKRTDCNNLAAWRIAELWRAGVDAQPVVSFEENDLGGYNYHVYLSTPNGTEDPSVRLGMLG